MRYEVGRVVDNLIREPKGWAERALGLPGYPAVDVSDTGDEIVVRAEAPGVDPNQLEITVAGNVLTLAGERLEPAQNTERDIHQAEIRYGDFRRQVTLPAVVDAERVEAESRHGMVTIRLPKQLAGGSRRVEISPHE